MIQNDNNTRKGIAKKKEYCMFWTYMKVYQLGPNVVVYEIIGDKFGKKKPTFGEVHDCKALFKRQWAATEDCLEVIRKKNRNNYLMMISIIVL